MKLGKKEKIGLACIASAMLAIHVVPMMFNKCAEKRFICGGKEMLGAIPDIITKKGRRLMKRMKLA